MPVFPTVALLLSCWLQVTPEAAVDTVPATPEVAEDAAAEEASADAAREALERAVAHLREQSSYTFTQIGSNSGGGPGGGRRGRRGNAGAEDAGTRDPLEQAPILGHVQTDAPLHLTRDELEAWRGERVLVHRSGDGPWERIERPESPTSLSPGFGPDRFWSGRPSETRGLAAMTDLRRARAPHVLLAEVAPTLSKLTRVEHEDGSIVISGKLDQDSTSTLAMGGRRGRGPGGRRDEVMTFDGTLQVGLDANGAITNLTYDTNMVFSFGDRDFERNVHTDITLSAFGEAAPSVPDEVTQLLAAAPEDDAGSEDAAEVTIPEEL